MSQSRPYLYSRGFYFFGKIIEVVSMAKKTMATKLTRAEIFFEENGDILVVEHLKDEDREHYLNDILKDYEGKSNLSISISTEREI